MISILYIYITIFTLYFVVLALVSAKPERKIRDKYTSKDSNMCVILYATGEAGPLEYLIRQLKNQSYDKGCYSIYVFLDKVENPPEYIFQTELGINVVNVNNLEPIGKSQAYSILAEKLSEVPNLDAYVFMDSRNYVDSNFLENINFYLTKYSVFMPMITYIGEDTKLNFWNSVKVTYATYISNFLYSSRTRLRLTNLINTNAFVIKRDLLNKIGSFNFKDINAEADYTLKLAKEKFAVVTINDLKIYREIENFDLRNPSLSKRIERFFKNWTHCNNFTDFEFVISNLTPNWIMCLLIYGFLLSHTYHFGSIKVLGLINVGYYGILISFIVLLLAFCMSLLHAGVHAKGHLHLFSYAIYSIGHIIINFPPIRIINNFIKNKRKKHHIEKMETNVVVTDGKQEYICKIELISDDGLAKVKFTNKGKSYTTKNNHLRMVDALKELSHKLNDYGLTLKICQCCKYFQPIIDGSTNMIQGHCKCPHEGRIEGDIIQTLIWNTCPMFEKENIVSLF